MPRDMVKSLSGGWCWALESFSVVVSMLMWSCRRWQLGSMFSWASSRRWGRALVGLDEGLDLLHLRIHLGIQVVRGIKLVVVVVDRRWNALPVHHSKRKMWVVEREERIPNVPWPNLKVDQWSLQCGQGNSTIGTNFCRFLTPTQVKAYGGAWLGWWHKIWCNCKWASIMLEKIHKIAMQQVDQAI